ncbi:ATP-binding protein [Leptospira sp. 201903070]|uniref:ATP-binding protein n=1 Tax=Leptospira ainlahdjerensis TaxID=2810033 RepID=A0ABS2UGP1_9LEPT|nr:AFG1/ZapE family ATPase [Leptospira ainlahdjerensis]MBM9578959.1 ATP-binding protein [Leptospira ainlahdjerensis]
MVLKKIVTIREGDANCLECGGVGFYLTEKTGGQVSSVLTLCRCISENCPCGGKQPSMVFDSSQSKMIPCVCRTARMEFGKMETLFHKSGIPSKYKFRTFDQMDHDSSIGIQFTIAHDWGCELVKNWKDDKLPNEGLYLWGNPGTGKTLLACSILNEMIFRYQENCKYAKINRDFFDIIRDSYQKRSEIHGKEKTIEDEFANIPILVLDDFGVQKETDWTNSKLYDLIDARYEQGRLTILTSNLPLSTFKNQAEGRVYSRLKEMTKELSLADCADYREKLAK